MYKLWRCNHDMIHLFWKCSHLVRIWRYINQLFTIDVNPTLLIFEIDNNDVANNCISLLLCIIYKKYITDRPSISNVLLMYRYFEIELSYYVPVYSCSRFESIKLLGKKILNLKNMLTL